MGYRGDELVSWGDPEHTLRETLAAVADGAELVTCIVGRNAPLDGDAIERAVPDGVELELQEGGQPAWWWLLCRRMRPFAGDRRATAGRDCRPPTSARSPARASWPSR